MANYSTSQHTLSLSANYNQLYVNHVDNGLVATYNLNGSSQSVSITVVDSNFAIDYATTFTTATHVWDVNGGDSFGFTSSTLDGIVIVDVRDINRLDLDEGQYGIHYSLDCTTYRLRNVSGSDGFLIHFTGTGCFSTEEL